MGKYLFAAAAFAASALASPIQERGLSCQYVTGIINIMRAQNVATPFCSSVLSIPTITTSVTSTSTPPCTTITTSVASTGTTTSIATSVVYGTTTVYPVQAVSVTSTCALGATVIPQASQYHEKRGPPPGPAGPAGGPGPAGPPRPGPAGPSPSPCTTVKNYTPPPIGTPTCLTGFNGPSLTSACSCLSIPTPTTTSVVTTTLAQQTITKVIAGVPAKVTVTSTITTTSFTSTYSATQYYTSTFTILPSPTSIKNYPDGSSFGFYPGLDFSGMDITNFFCYQGGPAPPSPFPPCASYDDCVAECVYYNDNNLGGSTKCGTVTYNAPSDGSSGSCYLKTGQVGCGSANPMTNSSVVLPLVPNDVQ